MLRTLILIVALTATQASAVMANDQAAKRLEMAKALVAHLAAGEFDRAIEPFDPTMKRVMPAAKLKEVWSGLTTQYGPLERATETRIVKTKRYEFVFVTCEFHWWKLDAKVVFDADNLVTGLFFVPSGKYKPPSYADPAKFEEKALSIGSAPWSLPGTLLLPKGEGPFPAVVLVHGSGPNDRDETLGPNKPFRDLASGLASRGIAVLRYEKRTKQYPLAMSLLANSITVKAETVDDASAAVDALAACEKIDRQRIFVLGHSLGGSLIPRIATANHRIAGFISLAGSTRPLEDVILEQTRYILSLDGKISAGEQKQLDELAQQVARVKSPELSAKTGNKALPLGVPVPYWIDLRGYDPAEAAVAVKRPLLILQGERDYQVTMEDFGRWKKALAARKDVTFISYPALNHLFIAGKGPGSPAEYSTQGNVAEKVVLDIAQWIKGQHAD